MADGTNDSQVIDPCATLFGVGLTPPAFQATSPIPAELGRGGVRCVSGQVALLP